jgi:hypothetical protein
MKKLLFASLMSLSTLVGAESQAPAEPPSGSFMTNLTVGCAPTMVVVTALVDKYKEKPIWNATDEGGFHLSLWVNNETRTFTLIKSHLQKKISCVLGSGVVNQSI